MMVKLSPRSLPLPKLNKLQKDLWRAIASLESPEEIEDFFVDLLTHTERKMLAKRFGVAVLLLQSKSYAEIMKQLIVGNGVVSSVHNLLKTGATTLERVAKSFSETGEQEDRDGEDDGDESRSGYYMSGNILMPVLDDAARLVRKKIREKKRGY